jgi:hypothetical protein
MGCWNLSYSTSLFERHVLIAEIRKEKIMNSLKGGPGSFQKRFPYRRCPPSLISNATRGELDFLFALLCIILVLS